MSRVKRKDLSCTHGRHISSINGNECSRAQLVDVGVRQSTNLYRGQCLNIFSGHIGQLNGSEVGQLQRTECLNLTRGESVELIAAQFGQVVSLDGCNLRGLQSRYL